MKDNALFKVNRLNEDGMKKADDIAAVFNMAYERLAAICPTESSQFKTAEQKLEEACFYAKKSVASLVKNQAKGG